MSFFDSLLGNPGSGYEKGQDQLNKYYSQAQGYLNPYNQNGMSSYGDYSNAMKSLLDPVALQNQWAKSYTESDSAKNAQAMAQSNGLNAASALGLNGSNTALNAIQGGTSRIAMDDQEQYMNDLMQKYMAGAGIAGNIYNTGSSAANNMSHNAMNMGQDSAQMAYGAENASSDLWGSLLGTAVGGASGGMGKWLFGGK